MPMDDSLPEPDHRQDKARLSPAELERRREELLREGRARVADARSGRAPREVNQSRVRMRMLLLPAFGMLLFMHFGSRAGAPLGVHAAFTPGGGESFAGPRAFDASVQAEDRRPIEVVPGDVVGTKSGTASILELGQGRLVLEPGARAVVASLMPSRARLLGGNAQAEGRLRVVTAHGIYDIDEGLANLSLSAAGGLIVKQIEGSGVLVGPDGEQRLVAGTRATSQ